MKKSFNMSLEETIRNLQKKNANRPSPLAMMQNNPGFVPTQVPNHMRSQPTTRDTLLGGFKPNNDSFRL